MSKGGEWSVQTTPSPTNYSYFTAVSCASSSACMAVGREEGGVGGVKAMAEAWNGKEWSVQSLPSEGSTDLVAVSCPSSSECFAVSGSGVDRWNGTKWSTETLPAPEGAVSTSAEGVSCATTTACTVVGDYNNGKNSFAMAEGWNGKEWAVQKTPLPSEATSGALRSVSCVSSKECTAVGKYSITFEEFTLAEVWNGKEWAIQTTPTFGTYSVLESVSCTSKTVCAAFGRDNAGNGTIAENLSGTTWSSASVPSAPMSGSAVSCTSATACIATGNTGWSGFVYSWNGTSWSSEGPLSNKEATTVALAGASCTSATECTVVGNYTNGSGETLTFAGRMSKAKEWAAQTTPSPGSDSKFASVSCASATACTAVGSVEKLSGGSEPLAEGWNGKEWSTETVPVPAKAEKIHLFGVSCTSATECTAVGSYVGSGVITALAERWNGKEWATEAVPLPEGGKEASLRSVSCGSTTVCNAVGDYTNTTGRVALADRWSSKKWAAAKAANPTGATTSELLGASCFSSSSECMAAGKYTNATGEELTVAEFEISTLWGVVKTSNPSTKSYLEAVSCTSSTSCMALGGDSINGTILAELYS